MWTGVSWAVSAAVGIYAGKKLHRPAGHGSGVALQPAQS